MTSPDVTVVVAVYNTMPYLTDCLNSLVGQSIGLDRLEIVAVDDGSTDDSAAELDRFAKKYPDTVKVIHQANSGGPAAPSNRALDLATGRYVYFIGSDDHLGKEALERMVAYADKHESDVVIGKMVGTNGRYVHQALFKKSDPDISMFDSALPYTLANTKLFRRELVEKHNLRFPEDLPVGSDMPFTIEACVRARQDLGARGLHVLLRGEARGREQHHLQVQPSVTAALHREDHASRRRAGRGGARSGTRCSSVTSTGSSPSSSRATSRRWTPGPGARCAPVSPIWPTSTSRTR